MSSLPHHVIVVIGVSGAGKTTVGQALAHELGVQFIEGDDFHSVANRQKMHAGIPLTDADREPWLAALRGTIAQILEEKRGAVVSCSALKRAYRDDLRRPEVVFVYLKVHPEVIRARLAQRHGHFFNPTLLDSQFATLEEPQHALVVDAEQSVSRVVQDIVNRLPEWAARAS